MKALIKLAALLSLLAPSASAVVVWSDDFADDSSGTAPSRNFFVGSGNDWTITNVGSTAVTQVNASGSLEQLDNDAGSNPVAQVFRSRWSTAATLNSTTNILRVSYDVKVASYGSSVSDTSTPRFILRDTNAANTQIIIGWGRGAGTDATLNQLIFYAQVGTTGNSVVTPSSSNAVGFGASGFNFGAVSATAADNSTDETYRVSFNYDFNTGGVAGTITNLFTSESAGFNRTMSAGLDFSAGGGSDGILLSGGGPNTSDALYDNFIVEIVPEPSTSILALGGLGLAFLRRKLR